MKLKYQFAVSEIADKKIAFVIGDGMGAFRSFLKMNETGFLIFQKLETEISEDELIAQMSQAYPEDTYDTVSVEVKEFVKKLSEAGLLQ